MKILVVSDTHDHIDRLIQNLKNMEKMDMLFHLGDYVEDGIKIGEELNIPTIIVRGNGDYNRLDFNEDELVEIKGKKIFLTHGHKYNVRRGITNLYYKALEEEADIVLFGHTHVPIVEHIDGITIMNPGSPSFPRGYDRKDTFGILILNDGVEYKIIEIK